MTPFSVWDDECWTALPTLEGTHDTDVCVIGLGSSGLEAVHELHRRRVRVVGIDAAAVGSGAAGRNGGLLLAGTAAFHHRAVAAVGRERAAAAYRLTLDEIERIAGPDTDVKRTGSLRIAADPDEEADCAAHLAALAADGFPAEPYEGSEGVGLLLPSDGIFQPLRACRRAARVALDAGIALFESSPAVLSAREVRTPNGRLRCERIVVAVDGFLERLLPELAGRVRSTRLQMLATAPAREVSLPSPVYSRYGYDYWQQLGDGRIVLGGMRDQFEGDEWEQAAEHTEPVQRALERLLRDKLGVRAPVTHRWAGVVAYTADGLPVIEEVRPGVFATGAYSGTGNVVGRLAGRAAAELAVTGTSETAAVLSSRA